MGVWQRKVDIAICRNFKWRDFLLTATATLGGGLLFKEGWVCMIAGAGLDMNMQLFKMNKECSTA